MNRKLRRQQEKNHKKILGSSAKDVPISQAFEMMVASYEESDCEKALKIADKILTVMPDDFDVLHFAGTMALELGRYDNAIKHLEKTVAIKPDHGEAWNGIGYAYLANGQIDQGIAACQKAVALLGDMPEAHYNLGNAFSAAGRMDEAIESFQSAINAKPAYPEALNNMGNAYQALRKFDDAQDAFRQALKVEPTYHSAKFNLANALMAGNKMKDAIATYRESIEANQQHIPSYNNLATVFRQLGQLPEAADIYRQAITISPQAADLHNNLGVVLQDFGQREESAESFKHALELNSQNAEAAFNLHTALFDDSDMSPAIEHLEQALSIDPSHERAHFMLGTLLDHAGDTDGAKTHFDPLPLDSEGYHPTLDSWDYIKTKRGANTRWFAPTADTLRHCIAEATIEGAVLEFGVRYGASSRLIATAADQPIHGFDSFEGLPEDWYSEKKGSYTTFGELPDMPDLVTLHAGWFEDTLPAYMKEFDEPVRFLHIDCDLYASTVTVLQNLAPRIAPGTVILFDEYLMNPGWRNDEFKAFQEAVEAHGWDYEYIAFSLFAKQTGVRILSA
jgi:tetratricopeptide (TPR) repeat protein